ncbi:glycoside hydrolase family 88 protein [Marinilabilia sp.]|uniref:glycoside hydrolase family 88/105 protein n=1 Tax=Marinilabilia sp. TaxID=2021252 RepID=UPI0025C05404|nr:glycoside hydrolase family 88 protein [Marinilabilia sp.]
MYHLSFTAKRILLSLLFVGLVSCDMAGQPAIFDSENANPEEVGRKIIKQLLERDEIMMYETDFLNTVHYAEAITAMGAIKLAGFLTDSAFVEGLKGRYEGILANFDTLPANHVDANVIGVLPLQFYHWSKNPKYKRMGLQMADKQWENPLPGGLSNQVRYWIDDMYMIGILQIEAFKATGDSRYIDRVALTMNDYLNKLQQPNGLFFHGPQAPFFWSRGNGWMAVAMAELLSVLPRNHPSFNFISESYLIMMNSLVHYQVDSGLWRQLIDYEDAWEESSGSAMFAYAIKLGVDHEIILGDKYEDAWEKAWLALANRVDDKGKLSGVCVGTGQSKDPQYYLDRPSVSGDLHGQAPMLWLSFSILESFEN